MDSEGRPLHKDVPQPLPSQKQMLEENIRTSRKWADALGRVQCSGKDALLIAGLLGFLEDQHAKSLAEYEAAMAKNASWGRPKDLEANMVGAG